MWLTMAAAGFFGFVVLITLMRAEKSVANGALTVITLLAIGIAVAATVRGDVPGVRSQTADYRPADAAVAGLPALSCVDDLAGEAVLAACEKVLFASPEAAAAAVGYAGSLITRLTAQGDVAAANNKITPELQAVRRAVEHDRYGLVAQVLVARDNCTPAECAAFAALTDRRQIVANMDAHLYETLIARYSASWNAPLPVASAPAGAIAGLPVTLPTGKPTNAEFPSAASTPAVSIMNPEPGTGAIAAAAAGTPPRPATAATAPPSPKPAAPSTHASAPAPAKKPAPKPPRASAAAAPVQIAPAQAQPAATASE